ncbi:hypothetical protein [Nocardia sp. CA-135398]|uniref:hypothetical protein n=1 Tax=Nocardia sp. CA-135398 TaxID=3239977 RepID=UPI003D9953A9
MESGISTLPPAAVRPLSTATAAALPTSDVLTALAVTDAGLTEDESSGRLRRWGPNAVSTH